MLHTNSIMACYLRRAAVAISAHKPEHMRAALTSCRVCVGIGRKQELVDDARVKNDEIAVGGGVRQCVASDPLEDTLFTFVGGFHRIARSWL